MHHDFLQHEIISEMGTVIWRESWTIWGKAQIFDPIESEIKYRQNKWCCLVSSLTCSTHYLLFLCICLSVTLTISSVTEIWCLLLCFCSNGYTKYFMMQAFGYTHTQTISHYPPFLCNKTSHVIEVGKVSNSCYCAVILSSRNSSWKLDLMFSHVDLPLIKVTDSVTAFTRTQHSDYWSVLWLRQKCE